MITFAGNPLDRTAHKRDDAAWLASQLPNAIVFALAEGKPLVEDGRLARVAPADPALFLGMWSARAVFAVEAAGDPRAQELRAVALTLPAEEAAIIAAAKSLFEWHRRHRFCSACGTASEIRSAGWKRVCPSCATEHFPRVDPVVIMLPTRGDRCLLGRNSAWPRGRMAPLAGFIEPGESFEEACAREVGEEAGLVAKDVRYHASQPWPFPSSLMIGLFVEVAEGEAVPDGVELEELRWFTRDEIRSVLEGTHPDVLPPNRYAIARELLTTWVNR